MRERVDRPRDVQHDGVHEDACVPWVKERLVDKVPKNPGRQQEANDDRQRIVIFALKSDHRISIKVSHINPLSELFHIRMLLNHEPADVREEKSSLGVVRIGVGVGVLVVGPMVANPDREWVLHSHRVQENHNQAKLCVGLERAVREISMGRNGGAQCDDHPVQVPDEYADVLLRHDERCIERRDMKVDKVSDVWIQDLPSERFAFLIKTRPILRRALMVQNY